MKLALNERTKTAEIVELNNKQIVVTKIVFWDYDDFIDESLDEETQQKLTNGDLVHAIVGVTYTWENLEGSQYLGGCLLSKNVNEEVSAIISEYNIDFDAKFELVQNINKIINFFKN